MIYCKALDQEFESKAAMFGALKANRVMLISLKKAAIKTTDECAYRVPSTNIIKSDSEAPESLKYGDKVLNVINTTNYLDSHDDVHLQGVWDKSAPEQTGKTYHVVDHDLKVGSVVGYPGDVELSLKDVSWRDLGYDKDGITRALIAGTTMTDKTNIDAFKAYRDNAPVQHSVRMQYVNIELALNDPEDKEAFAVWNNVLPMIVNREKAEDQGYFFAVKEAKIYKEVSTVLFGSNDITPRYKDSAADKEPVKATPDAPVIDFVAMCKQFKL